MLVYEYIVIQLRVSFKPDYMNKKAKKSELLGNLLQQTVTSQLSR